jgi:glycosyltransferase involved in cell wall biosynthesis
MKILMLGRWLPPPRRPVRGTREYQFAHYLTRRHQLTMVFISDNSDSAGPISTLRDEFGDLEFAAVPRGWKSVSSAVRLVTGQSCTLSYFRSEALRTRLADRLRETKYDLVFVSSSSMIQYALDVDPAIPLVMDFGEVDSEWWTHQASHVTLGAARFFRTEAARLRLAEAAVARRAIHCVAESSEAAQIVRSLDPVAPISVIPNGVDVQTFGSVLRRGMAPTVVFNTSLTTDAQIRDVIEFWRSVIPAVRARIPQTRFVVSSKAPVGVGIAPGNLVEIEIRAPAPDLRQIFHSHAVAVAPLRASFDVRGSVLEPMAAGVPVVTTTKVSDHLGARSGQDLQVCDDPLHFANQVIELLEQTTLREQIGFYGRRFVEANFSWETVASGLGDLLARVGGASAHADTGGQARPLPAGLGG